MMEEEQKEMWMNLFIEICLSIMIGFVMFVLQVYVYDKIIGVFAGVGIYVIAHAINKRW